MTVLSIALFVAGGTLGLTFYRSLDQKFVSTAAPDAVIVMSQGAPAEHQSELPMETIKTIHTFDNIKRDAQGVFAVAELVTKVGIPASDPKRLEPAPVFRGLDERSLAVHGVTLVKGAAPQPGTLEVMLGRRLARRHPELGVGATLSLLNADLRVTGIFADDGSPFEDEAWAPRSAVELVAKTKSLSSMTLVAESEGAVPALVSAINASKQIDARATTLRSFRAAMSDVRSIARTVGLMLLLLGIVATFAISTTMSSSIARRIPELAALAAIGIRKSVLARGVIFETVLLAVVGGVVGALLGELVRRQLGEITLGANPVELAAIPSVMLFALVLSVVVGVIGGIAPALRVSRLSIVDAIR